MIRLSPHEHESVQRRIAYLEARLRELSLDNRFSAAAKLKRWQELYAELKHIRQLNVRWRYITKVRPNPLAHPASRPA